MSCGIYKITNIVNGHAYIGQSINIEERWKNHRCHPKEHSQYPLYRAFEKYGMENFKFEIIELCSQEELNEREIFYIQKYGTYGHGYNQTRGGQGSTRAVKLSDEDIATIYDLLRNSKLTQKEIAARYKVGEDTISEINNGKTRINFDVEYPIRVNIKPKPKCEICGSILKTREATICRECAYKKQRKCERPSREELKKLIRTTSFLQIGRQYGVSDNAIRKWCILYGLPSKKTEIKTYSDEQWELK